MEIKYFSERKRLLQRHNPFASLHDITICSLKLFRSNICWDFPLHSISLQYELSIIGNFFLQIKKNIHQMFDFISCLTVCVFLSLYFMLTSRLDSFHWRTKKHIVKLYNHKHNHLSIWCVAYSCWMGKMRCCRSIVLSSTTLSHWIQI